MMTQFRNSLTWRDTVKYAVDVYSFLIRGEGTMSGRKFAEHIRKYYSSETAKENSDGTFSLHCAYNKRAHTVADCVEKHIVTIEATYKGTRYGII